MLTRRSMWPRCPHPPADRAKGPGAALSPAAGVRLWTPSAGSTAMQQDAAGLGRTRQRRDPQTGRRRQASSAALKNSNVFWWQLFTEVITDQL